MCVTVCDCDIDVTFLFSVYKTAVAKYLCLYLGHFGLKVLLGSQDLSPVF